VRLVVYDGILCVKVFLLPCDKHCGVIYRCLALANVMVVDLLHILCDASVVPLWVATHSADLVKTCILACRIATPPPPPPTTHFPSFSLPPAHCLQAVAKRRFPGFHHSNPTLLPPFPLFSLQTAKITKEASQVCPFQTGGGWGGGGGA